MKTMRTLRWTLCGFLGLCLSGGFNSAAQGSFNFSLIAAAAPVAAASPADTREELKQRFEQRFKDIEKLKRAGDVGETWEGYVRAVDERLLDDKGRKLIEAENADRRKLYQLIGDEVVEDKEGRSRRVPVGEVGEENAKRNFKRAEPNEHLWVKEGRWVVKKDEARYSRLVKLKNDRTVGETHEGYIEVVAQADADTEALVKAENDARRKMYESLAKRLKTEATQVAADAARQIEKSLQPGRMFKQKNGTWRKQPE